MQPSFQPSYLDTVQANRQQHQQSAKQDSDLQSMLAELKKMQMAAMMGQSKPSVVLTDQTDLGDKMGELADKVAASIQGLDSSKVDADHLSTLSDIKDCLDGLKTATEGGNDAHADKLDSISKAITELQINVPVPKVTVQAPAVDLKPLQTTLKELLAKDDDDTDKVDFDDYRAQDLLDNGDVQYVGFLNPDGEWYIIENNISGNTMRYVFGSSNYAAAFKKAAQYQYKLLNEAVK